MIICRTCATARDITVPPVRTTKLVCEACGKSDDPTGQGRNFTVANVNVLGSEHDPNRIAEQEANS